MDETSKTLPSRPASSSGEILLESERLYRLVVATVSDYAIFALDPTGRVVTWNAGAEKLKGYLAEEIIGSHFSIFYPPVDIAARKPDNELVVAERDGRVEDEGWRLRKDGSRFWASVVITALRNEKGHLVGFAKVTRDLTERMQAERAVRDSEERFRLLVEGVRDYGIFMLDPDGRIASWNLGAERMEGYTADEIIGRHFSIFYPPVDLAWNKPDWELQMARRDGRFEDEGWRLRKDGSRFWANVVITTLQAKSGEIIGFSKVTRDLTERRRSEQRALADARKVTEAEAANVAKTEFLAAMSHELRTPLNAIAGYTDLLSAEIPGEINQQQQEYLDRIKRSQQHLLAIISDLLNFSRIEAGTVIYDVTPVRVSDAVASVTSMIETAVRAKDIALAWSEPDAEVMAMADRPKLEQILINLLSNALKFTDRGTISISATTADWWTSISVADTGRGIPADSLEKIFEPFVQVGRSLTTTQEGTGLGLAISRELARAMGGELIVQSELDVGSTFTLTLPAPDLSTGP